ncbi:MAG: prepilin-type N-terminal cleavage/methylation domain-containing protein [Planctomycetota bacterium]|jgi:excisionase family DNA binding protein/prepilin-type N-terminal cleavage/methylation domain-containing protein
MCIFEKNLLSALWPRRRRIQNSGRGPLSFQDGFSLIETVAALTILSLISLSVLVVVDRCLGAMADSDQRMQAFEVARDNMERLLIQARVEEKIEYGSSEKNPDILWQNTVETFYEPLTSRMWVKATCSAQYSDTEGEVQTVELTHWLTSVTKKQILQMAEQREKELQRLAEADQLIETIEEAAEYTEVDVETIEEWTKSGGMPVTEAGGYVKLYLDLYGEYDGDPPIEARLEADEEYAGLTGRNVTGGLVPTGPVMRRVPGMPGTTPGAPPTPGASPPAGGPEAGSSPSPGQGSGEPTMTREKWRDLGFPDAWYPLFYPDATD